MVSSLLKNTASKAWLTVSNPHIQNILFYLHFISPILLLVIFLAAFTTHSIRTASSSVTVRASPNQTGPGGKPLPTGAKAAARRAKVVLDFSPARKLLFKWISVGVLLTFIANATNVLLHALLNREDGWWCGESVAVSCPACLDFSKDLGLIISLTDLHHSLIFCLWAISYLSY